MAQFQPKVSIVIPVYNGAKYVRDAIDSALAQTYKNIEVIVVNDGSRDEGATEKIALSYGNRIRYFSKPNGGVATALNMGIEKMEGEYFSWLSHDDKYDKHKIESQIRYLEGLEDKKTLLFGGYANFSDDVGIFERLDFFERYSREQLETPLFPVLHLALNGCALLIHKSHFQRVGMFDPALPTTQDYDLWFRMFRGQRAQCVPGIYMLSRSHPEQGSKMLLDTHIEECTELWLHVYSTMTDQEKLLLANSLYDFYQEQYDFFHKTTGYTKVHAFLRGKALQELVKMRLPMDPFYVSVLPELSLLNTQPGVMDWASEKKTKTRVAFFLGNPNEMGGLNRIVLRTAEALCQWYDVWLIDTLQVDGTGYPLSDKIKQVTVAMDISKVVDLLHMIDADVLVGSYNCLDFMLQLYDMLAVFPIKIIAWSHEHYHIPYLQSEYHTLLQYRQKVLHKIDVVIWLTNYSRQIYALHGNNGVVIPNMISFTPQAKNAAPAQRKDAKQAVKQPTFIGVGRFEDPRKGLNRLLQTYALIRKQIPDAKLYVIGSYNLDIAMTDPLKSEQSLTPRQLMARCHLTEEDVVFTGMISNVERYYQEADVHLLTSTHEGFGLVITEAAYYHVPTIAFDGNGAEDIIENGSTGYIVKDIHEMADKALKLVTHPNQIKKMGIAAKASMNRFSEEAVTTRWRDLIDHLVELSKEEFEAYLSVQQSSENLTTQQYRAIIQELEKDIVNTPVGPASSIAPSVIVQQNTQDAWKEQFDAIQQTLSWRVTKPLRAVRKLQLKLFQGFRKK